MKPARPSQPGGKIVKRKTLLAAAILCLVSVSAANAMDVGTFLAKAAILQDRGVLAMFASEYGELQAEIGTSFAALKQERLAAQSGGRRPAYCPPGPARLTMEETMAAMLAVPPARRAHVQVRDALRAALARKYPCRP
jgi:hypothetical protein